MMPDWPWPRSYRYLCKGLQSQRGDLRLFFRGDLEFRRGIVLQPAAQVGEHRFCRSAGRADDEDVAELQRVFTVSLVQGAAYIGSRVRHPRLLALRHLPRVGGCGRVVPVADLRVVREGLEPIVLVERVPHHACGAEQGDIAAEG